MHYFYDKILPDGPTSGTMVSFGRDGETIPSEMWSRVWRHQLRLRSEADFWQGLEGGRVDYDIPPAPEPTISLPSYLERFLRDNLHYSDEEIAATNEEQAQRLLNAYYSRELRGGPDVVDDPSDRA
jgi:hypothetical protein